MPGSSLGLAAASGGHARLSHHALQAGPVLQAELIEPASNAISILNRPHASETQHPEECLTICKASLVPRDLASAALARLGTGHQADRAGWAMQLWLRSWPAL